MRDLFSVLAPEVAWQKIEPYLSPVERKEKISTAEGVGRILTEEMVAPENLPSFPRSAMDGYAVRAEDTYGASETLPICLKVAGEVPVGGPAQIKLSPREAVLVHTGSMIPEGASAVVMVEYTQPIDASAIEVVRPMAAGENVLQVGEELRQGTALFSSGHLLRPQDIGALLALGVTEVTVFAQVRVALISTGDELVAPQKSPAPGGVRDVNTYTLSALTRQAGGIPVILGIVEDNYEALRKEAERGMEEGDIVVISAGSSVSTRDMTAQIISSLGAPGILVQGVAVRPGKPTILAVAGRQPVVGLPGNPVSAMVIFDLFVVPAIYKLGGCAELPRPATVEAKLTHNIPSASGREDYVPVKLKEREGELWAEPVFGKSNFISILAKAEGMVRVPLDKAGLRGGERVRVKLF